MVSLSGSYPGVCKFESYLCYCYNFMIGIFQFFFFILFFNFLLEILKNKRSMVLAVFLLSMLLSVVYFLLHIYFYTTGYHERLVQFASDLPYIYFETPYCIEISPKDNLEFSLYTLLLLYLTIWFSKYIYNSNFILKIVYYLNLFSFALLFLGLDIL